VLVLVLVLVLYMVRLRAGVAAIDEVNMERRRAPMCDSPGDGWLQKSESRHAAETASWRMSAGLSSEPW
jgi:hypothetical protein